MDKKHHPPATHRPPKVNNRRDNSRKDNNLMVCNRPPVRRIANPLNRIGPVNPHPKALSRGPLVNLRRLRLRQPQANFPNQLPRNPILGPTPTSRNPSRLKALSPRIKRTSNHNGTNSDFLELESSF